MSLLYQYPSTNKTDRYKLAEKLSDRLDEMGKDLTSMIEEVNGASATLSKTNKADEPVSQVLIHPSYDTANTILQISQIVRILNSHLSQLQVIDQGTSDLQAKVAAAHQAGQSISGRLGYGYASPGMGNGHAADDFYRSYMGRR
jgi:nuclear pore complex protein Nup62